MILNAHIARCAGDCLEIRALRALRNREKYEDYRYREQYDFFHPAIVVSWTETERSAHIGFDNNVGTHYARKINRRFPPFLPILRTAHYHKDPS